MFEVRSPDIRIITIRVATSVKDPSPNAFPDLSPLAIPLDAPPLRRLEIFCIAYSGPLNLDIVTLKVSQALPSAHQRGIIRVVRA